MLVHMVCMALVHVCILVHRVCMLVVKVCMLWYRLIKDNGKVTCNYEAKNYIEQIYEVVDCVKVIYTFFEFSF